MPWLCRIVHGKSGELEGGGVAVARSGVVLPNRSVCRSAETSLLRMQQPSPDHVEVSQRRRDFEAVQVLGEAAVADLLSMTTGNRKG